MTYSSNTDMNETPVNETAKSPSRRRGAAFQTRRCCIRIESDLYEWAKGLDGGISRTVRVLLQDHYEACRNSGAHILIPQIDLEQGSLALASLVTRRKNRNGVGRPVTVPKQDREYINCCLMLEEHVADWALSQDGGLSLVVRVLLRQLRNASTQIAP